MNCLGKNITLSVLRVRDIQAVVIDADTDGFETRVLKARGQWPPTAPDVDLSGLTEIISSKKFWLETTASAKMRKRPMVNAGAVAEG